MSEHTSRRQSRAPRAQDTAGMRAMFWTWTTLIAVGLVVMIITPLTGR